MRWSLKFATLVLTCSLVFFTACGKEESKPPQQPPQGQPTQPTAGGGGGDKGRDYYCQKYPQFGCCDANVDCVEYFADGGTCSMTGTCQ